MATFDPRDVGTSVLNLPTNGNITAVSNAYDIFNTAVNTYDYKIQGQALYAEHVVSDYTMATAIEVTELERMARERLTALMLQEIVKKQMVEFTKMKNPDGSIVFRARMFVTPNDQVRILRLAKEIK